jgi:hypothetical protein
MIEGDVIREDWGSPVVLVDGRMESAWEYARQGANVVVTVETFGTLTAKIRRGIKAEAQRLGEFPDARVVYRDPRDNTRTRLDRPV